MEVVEQYSLPIKINSRFKWYDHLMFIFFIGLFLGFSFIPISRGIWRIVYIGASSLFSFFFFSMWLYIGILKKYYIKITEDYLEINNMFSKSKMVKWNEIYDISFVTQNNVSFLGIILKEKMAKRKQSFLTELNELLGGSYSLRIALRYLSEVDNEKLYVTIVNKVKSCENEEIYSSENYSKDDDLNNDKNNVKNNLYIALIKTFILSIIIGIGYGVSMYFFNVNIIFIPILGTMAIVYTYEKNYIEDKINILTRMLIGIITSLQAIVAMIVSIILMGNIPINFENLLDIINSYFKYLISNPMDNLIIILIIIFTFYYGSFQGRTFRLQRKLGKISMKKSGDYYYKKEGGFIDIYTVNPEDYDEFEDGKLAGGLSEGCYIEKDKKRVLAFYIPKKFIDEENLKIKCSYVQIKGEFYCKIDLGGSGEYKPYVYPCGMIISSKRQVELIQVKL